MAPQALGTRALRCGLLRVADLVPAELEELRLGDVLQRDVQAVDPGHRRLRRVVVRVPVPAGLRQEVAAAHRHRVAADDRPDALALEHEAEGVLRVPVLGRVLPRHQVLDRRPQRRRGERAAVQARVGEGDRAALAAAAHRDEAGPPAPRARAGCPTATGAAAPSTAGGAASGRRSPSTAGSAAPSRSPGTGLQAPASRPAGSPPPPPSGGRAIRSRAWWSCPLAWPVSYVAEREILLSRTSAGLGLAAALSR